MSYHLLRVATGWIINDVGDFYVEDIGICGINKLCTILLYIIL